MLSAKFASSFRHYAMADDDDDDEELLQPMDDIGMYGILVPVDKEDSIVGPQSRDTTDIGLESPREALDKRSWMRSGKVTSRTLSPRKPFIGQKKRKLSAGEWVSILQGIAQNKGILLKGKLKGVRFGISRK